MPDRELREAAAGLAALRADIARARLLGLESRLLTTLAAEETVAAPTNAAEMEIDARRTTIEDDRRLAEHNRLLSKSFYP